MNAEIQALRAALTVTTDEDGTTEQLHRLLTDRSRKLQVALDKVTTCVDTREDKYAQIKALRDEMTAATEAMLNADETYDGRSVTQIAAKLKQVNDSIDREIDKVYDLISQAETLRREVAQLVEQITAVPLVATAA